MEHVLVVEDEAKLRRVLVDFLKSEGYDVISAADGEQGLALARGQHSQVIILDIMLPKKSGFDVCRELRALGVRTPILMLTAKGEEVDKVLGLELGADDYMTKPFGLKELNARLHALLRRAVAPAPKTGDQYALGPVIIDFKQQVVIRGKKATLLSATEASLLKYFIRHRGEVITRETLLNQVWGYERFPTTRTVDTHVLNLRKKIEDHPENPKWILTLHGSGYKFTG